VVGRHEVIHHGGLYLDIIFGRRFAFIGMIADNSFNDNKPKGL
jgi:hypothetical protein